MVEEGSPGTEVHEGAMKDGKYWIDWSNNSSLMRAGLGKVISADEMGGILTAPIILDIDLDAFSCSQDAFNAPENHDGVNDWEIRLEETMNLLKKNGLKPNLITVAESQGEETGGGVNWIPKATMDDVKKQALEKLTNF